MTRPGLAVRSGIDALCVVLALALLAGLVAMAAWLWQGARQPLLLAPTTITDATHSARRSIGSYATTSGYEGRGFLR